MNNLSIQMLVLLIVLLLKSVIGVSQDSPSIQYTRDTIILKAPDIRYVDDGWNLVNGQINGATLHFMAMSREDSLFQYIFGSKKIVSAKSDSVEALAIFLRRNDMIVSEINFEIDFRFMGPGGFNVIDHVLIDGIDKVLDFGFGRGACGYGYNNALFFRRANQLIKGMLLFTDGEGGASYDQYQFVPPLNKSKNQIWVEHKEGFYPVEHDEIIYYTEYLRYKYEEGNLRLLNPMKDKFQYVNSINGLSLMSDPEDERIYNHEYLVIPYGAKVKVKNKTGLIYSVYQNGRHLTGHWVKVEYQDPHKGLLPGYVQGGYLQKSNPFEGKH